MATAEFSKFAGILSAAHSQHHLPESHHEQWQRQEPLPACSTVMVKSACSSLGHWEGQAALVVDVSYMSGFCAQPCLAGPVQLLDKWLP